MVNKMYVVKSSKFTEPLEIVGKFETFLEARANLITKFRSRRSSSIYNTDIIKGFTEFEEIYIIVEGCYSQHYKNNKPWLKKKFYVSSYVYSIWIEIEGE